MAYNGRHCIAPMYVTHRSSGSRFALPRLSVRATSHFDVQPWRQPAASLTGEHICRLWFQRRVIEDEARLQARFGADYLDYRGRVKRWIPGLL